MDTKNVADTLISFMKKSPAPKKTRKAKEKEDTNLADVLMKKPKPDKKNTTMPHFTTNLPKDERHQADTLYLPNDNGYKYALVVVDVGTRMIDAEPLKNRDSLAAAEALHKIYKRKILSAPTVITCDQGVEFKSEFKKYCTKNNIFVRYGKKYRHRQTALAEKANARISRPLFKRMLEEEVLTEKTSRQWVSQLPKVVKQLNEERKKIKLEPEKETYECFGDDCDLLEQGTIVRVILDAPVDFLTEDRLHGYSFRYTDTRWSKTKQTITKTFILPNQPPMYCLDEDENTSYTKGQLLVVDEKNEKKPDK
jgi:transposase-like protein